MTLPPCDPFSSMCNILNASNSNDTFKQAVLIALGRLVGAGAAGTSDVKAFKTIASGQTDNVLQPAVAGKRYRGKQVLLTTDDTSIDVTFNSKGVGAGTAISPTFDEIGNAGFTLPYSSIGWFQTNIGEALTVTTNAGSSNVDILYAYDLVDF